MEEIMVKDKNLDKLKQKDRVEYLLRKNEIDKEYDMGIAPWIIIVVSFVIVMGSTGLIETHKSIALTIIMVGMVAFLVGILTWLSASLYSVHKKQKEYNKINEKFFEVKAK